jgi:molybdate transport system substrate-binding protein
MMTRPRFARKKAQRWTLHAWSTFWACALLVLFSRPIQARAEAASVAVAANFARTLEELAPAFEKQTGHELMISSGATGALYAQIKAGAPFEVLLAADAERPALLEKEGLAVAGTRFVYAQGKLVLWSPKPGMAVGEGKLLRQTPTPKVALADPAVAPYGAAAQEVLSALGLWQTLKDAASLVLGVSITQAHQFAASGNVSCGFVAYAQVLEGKRPGSLWKIPQSMYKPLLQEAVLLKRGAGKRAARAFLNWLAKDEKVLAALRAAGYERPKR